MEINPQENIMDNLPARAVNHFSNDQWDEISIILAEGIGKFTQILFTPTQFTPSPIDPNSFYPEPNLPRLILPLAEFTPTHFTVKFLPPKNHLDFELDFQILSHRSTSS